jgi:RNA polymerase sigma factor (sigma-70 family)
MPFENIIHLDRYCLMHPRTQILDRFSTFAVLEGEYFRKWISDSRLRRSMQSCLEGSSESSDQIWSLYWFKQWQSQNRFAEPHLSAYLQEPCYWVAQQISQRFKATQYTLADYFQITNGEIQRVLKSFSSDRGIALKSYATVVLTNALKDMLRQRQAAAICSDWSLLRQVSKKRIGEVIIQAGVATTEADQYQFAWFCFKTLYVPSESSGEQLTKPTAEIWIAIANFYNSKRKEFSVSGAALSVEQLEVRLTKLGRWIRSYLYPTVDSLNRLQAGHEVGEIQDTLTDSSESLLDSAIEQEDIAERTEQRSQIQTVLNQALSELNPEQREILQLFYQKKLSQQELAAHLKLSQPTVSRRLKKAEESLLNTLLLWSQSQSNRFPNPTEVKQISTALREWLIVHYVIVSEN